MVNFKQIIEGLSVRPKFGYFGYSSIVLIKDGNENILFDTGGLGVRSALLELLKDINIQKVFLSHLHLDHCANITLFKNSDIYVNQKEIDNIYSKMEEYNSDINDFIQKSLDNLKIITFSDNQEISNNTKSVCTYGHTVGHSSLEILSQDKRTIIAGDAIESYQEYLNDEYKVDCFDNKSYLISKKFIKDNYPIIVPGHSSIIEEGRLKNSVFYLRYF